VFTLVYSQLDLSKKPALWEQPPHEHALQQFLIQQEEMPI